MRTKSGSPVWILSRGKVVERDADNRPVRVIGIHTDVTTRKQIELELRIANEEQHAIFEAAATGIAFIQNRQIRRCNRKLEDLFGYDAEEFIGRLTRCWYASDAEFQTVGEEVARQLQQKGRHSAVRQLVRKDGSRFWARMTAQAIDPNDLSKGVVGMLEDITQERAASEALHRAKEEAEAATRAKSKFLANMSHEIRTPMNAIMGFAHLLRRDSLTPQQSGQLDKLTDASRHLLRIINNILDISKIEASKMTLDNEDFEPARVLDQVCGIVADPIAAKQLGFHVNLDHIPLVLRGDGARLGQVFLNLIGNALKFTEQGRIDIVGSLLSENDAQVVVRFEVRDTGIGMTGEQLQRVFVAFEQADSSTTRRFGGTGLGLAISKRLVELMGGTIGVESSPGRGTRFWFELPFARAEHPPVMRLPREVLGRMHALLIDEDRDSGEILANMLTELGMRVDIADSGEYGLEAVVRSDRSGDSHSLLVIDARLPGISGIETAARLQALDLSIRPTFVIITAYGGQLRPESVKTAGIHRVMPKPVTPSILYDTLVELIQPSMEYKRPDSAAEEELSKRRGAHILLVEDNPINQEVAKALLEAMGMEVSVADNGQIAVDMIGTASFDLVFMDIQMPVMDGLRAARTMRQRPEGRSIPILAMTANAFREDREQCLQAGMNDHIAKPIEQSMLQNLLIRWLPATNRNETLSDEKPSDPQPPQEDGQALLSLLHAIDGLDAKAGLQRLGGDHALYLHVLQRFVGEHGQTGEVLAALARRGD
ncbi:MAG: response regulator, partial [Desulfobulbus sp.]